MSDFDLLQLIASQRSAGPDPREIAAKVEPLIPDAELRTVVRVLLAHYIRETKPRLSQMVGLRSQASGKPPAKSAKVAAYRQHASFLRLTVSVGPKRDKYMESCTYDDLMAAAQIRRGIAANTLAAAAEYEALAALLKEHRVRSVGKLPPRVLDEFLSRERTAA